MRITLLTLALLVAMDADLEALLWLVVLLPALAAATFLALLLGHRRPARKRPAPRVWQEGERHLDPRPARQKPAHRRNSEHPPPGRHQPGRGRYARVARQAQLEERTEVLSLLCPTGEHTPWVDGLRLRCRSCLLDLPRPEGQPEIGAAGFHSWDHSKRNGKSRPRMAPTTPPPGERWWA